MAAIAGRKRMDRGSATRFTDGVHSASSREPVLADTCLAAFAVLYGVHWSVVMCGIARGSGRGRGIPGSTVPTLGLAIPVYNEARHIPTICSNLAAALELGIPVVIVDDGSTDSTAAMLALATADFPSVKIVRQKRNLGKAAALTLAFAELPSDIVMTIDADT